MTGVLHQKEKVFLGLETGIEFDYEGMVHLRQYIALGNDIFLQFVFLNFVFVQCFESIRFIVKLNEKDFSKTSLNEKKTLPIRESKVMALRLSLQD